MVELLFAFGLSLTRFRVLLFFTIATSVLCDPIERVYTFSLRVEVILEARHLWLVLFLLVPAGHEAAEVRLPLILTIFVFLRTTSHIEILCVDVLIVLIGAEHWCFVRNELIEHLTCSSHALSFFFIRFKLVSLGLIFTEPGSRVALYGLLLYHFLLV